MIDIHEVMKNTNDAIKSAVNEKIIIDPMIIVCKTDREVMLCEQVLRVVRGEPSQELVNTYWKDVQPDHIINIDKLIRYRAKPIKTLFIPWDFISDDINHISVQSKDCITAFKDHMDENGVKLNGLKLDLDGICLPVLAMRPRN